MAVLIGFTWKKTFAFNQGATAAVNFGVLALAIGMEKKCLEPFLSKTAIFI